MKFQDHAAVPLSGDTPRNYHTLTSSEEYWLQLVEKTETRFRTAAQHSYWWYIFCNIVSYSITGLIAIIGIITAANAHSNFLGEAGLSVLGIVTTVLIGVETVGKIKQRAAASKIVYDNYSQIAEKISSASAVMHTISIDGVSHEEQADWTHIINMIKAFQALAEKWPDANVISPAETSSSVTELRTIQQRYMPQESSV